jgi:hypothetical protein
LIVVTILKMSGKAFEKNIDAGMPSHMWSRRERDRFGVEQGFFTTKDAKD